MLIIGRGKLFRSTGEMYGVSLPPYQYQVRNLAGIACEHDYTGPGFDNGDNVRLGRADSASLAEYRVDAEPTTESVEEYRGFVARLRQLRASFPVKASEAFQQGWKDADRSLKDESKNARAERLNSLRWAREETIQ